MNRRIGVLALSGLMPLTLALAACGSGGTSGSDTYKIGLIDNSGGAFASNNKTAIAGAEYAVKQINDAGGINGKKVQITSTVDDQGEVKNGTTLVPKLAQQNVMAIVGPVDSGATEIAYAIAKQLKIPAVSPGAGRPGVMDSSRPFGFTLAEADADVSTPALEQIVKDQGIKTAAIIGDNVTATTKTQIPLFEGVFKNTGVQIVSRTSFKTGDSSFASQVTQMASAKPDVIALAAGPDDAGRIAREIKSQGLHVKLLGTSALQSGGAAYVKAGGDATDGTFSAAQYDPTNPDEPAKGLLAGAQKASGQAEIPLNYAYAYDAVNMIVQVIKEKGIKPGDNVATARAAIQKGLAALKTYDGMAGKTTFKQDGTGDRPTLVAVLKNGEFQIQH
ncbi:ABC transporter substrate-binding protein [Actinoallomurus iriomotensis]|uniref:Amino acid ABC transporter substrate-binding protein n=1 Tax=Actinoallomurus iriomotensis TaxID=478107 RepID=A0A9W6S873_9ACTN|nr:ABC transporter substrate-binding protein [Actinoallomurus iriomotensis]GLY88863.1 amino acid ABC transporter substrate-binding protein [Actinoallomurus iriomotensis]